jgi:hypothetical protein
MVNKNQTISMQQLNLHPHLQGIIYVVDCSVF